MGGLGRARAGYVDLAFDGDVTGSVSRAPRGGFQCQNPQDTSPEQLDSDLGLDPARRLRIILGLAKSSSLRAWRDVRASTSFRLSTRI